jgi:tRNA threonylcarbamoyladenosine biosynthesis protein TsaB
MIEMKVLLIDTCGATGSIALADLSTEPVSVLTASLPGRTASERLVPAIKDLVTSSGASLQSIGAIAVVSGPGSFTGVRVALSAAKGLCEALDLPLVAISRLAVLAHLARPQSGQRVRALLDAGRGELYSGLYADGICLRETLLTRDQFIAAHTVEPLEVVVTCDSAVAQSVDELAPRLVAEPRAEDALPLALPRIQQRDFDDVTTLDANYLRRTDAEIFAKPIAAQSISQYSGIESR